MSSVRFTQVVMTAIGVVAAHLARTTLLSGIATSITAGAAVRQSWRLAKRWGYRGLNRVPASAELAYSRVNLEQAATSVRSRTGYRAPCRPPEGPCHAFIGNVRGAPTPDCVWNTSCNGEVACCLWLRDATGVKARSQPPVWGTCPGL